MRNPMMVNEAGTVVGTNVKLTGTLRDNQDIVIHGTVEGEVISDKNVTIEETASVTGPIQASIVTVAGKVRGAVVALEKLEILPTGKLQGSVETKDLIVRSGAIFNGKSVMKNQLEAKPEKITSSKEEKKEFAKISEDKNFLDYEIEE